MVDRQNGMPKACAARAPRISPSPWNRPVRPVGAIANGMVTSSPRIVVATERLSTSIITRWRRPIAARSARFARSVTSS
jgi:hypothetical protein